MSGTCTCRLLTVIITEEIRIDSYFTPKFSARCTAAFTDCHSILNTTDGGSRAYIEYVYYKCRGLVTRLLKSMSIHQSLLHVVDVLYISAVMILI